MFKYEEVGILKLGCFVWYSYGWFRWVGFGDEYLLRFYELVSSMVFILLRGFLCYID